jgi:hypothetical protein
MTISVAEYFIVRKIHFVQPFVSTIHMVMRIVILQTVVLLMIPLFSLPGLDGDGPQGFGIYGQFVTKIISDISYPIEYSTVRLEIL